ncbi:MAG TPA: hypothetical protein VKV15_22550 [Bryobacteraceae bacterium]|nr:hypothetical protein [Bryobacteraceae bacterium]
MHRQICGSGGIAFANRFLKFDGLLRLLFYGLLAAGVHRLFVLSTGVAEIKEIPREFKHTSQVSSLASAIAQESPSMLAPDLPPITDLSLLS